MSSSGATSTIGVLSPSAAARTPGDLIHEAIALQALGADVIEIDAIDAGSRRGPFADLDEDSLVLLVAGLAERGVAVSVATTRPSLAGVAVEHGAAMIVDPSAGASPIESRVRDSACLLVAGPWAAHRSYVTRAPAVETIESDFLLVAGRLVDAGIAVGRIRFDLGAGVHPGDPERWRLLNELDRLADLGHGIVVSATDGVLASTVPEEAPAARLDDAAITIAALAAGVSAWAVRTHRVAVVTSLLRRLQGAPVPNPA